MGDLRKATANTPDDYVIIIAIETDDYRDPGFRIAYDVEVDDKNKQIYIGEY